MCMKERYCKRLNGRRAQSFCTGGEQCIVIPIGLLLMSRELCMVDDISDKIFNKSEERFSTHVA